MRKILFLLLSCFLLLLLFFSLPEMRYRNQGQSKTIGSPGNGQLENAYILPYSGPNFRYFSPVSYYLMDNAYTHSRVYQTLIQAYQDCEQTCPGIQFRIMECSDKNGGKLRFHRTHQNGMSVDFMVPKVKDGRQVRRFDHLGLLHYLLEFTPEGKLTLQKKVAIDFPAMGKHLIALDIAARENGLQIKKVILKLDLKDDLFATEEGKELKRRGIYFAQHLPKAVDDMHDDHYHVDFKLR